MEILNTIGAWLKEAAPWLIGASVVVEFVPIKINPWSWLAKKIGKAINGELITRLERLEKDVKKANDAIEMHSAKDARSAILHFGDDLIYHKDRKYSKDRFDEVVQRITEYDKYCDEHPDFPNHMTQSTSKLILNEYQRRMENQDFL